MKTTAHLNEIPKPSDPCWFQTGWVVRGQVSSGLYMDCYRFGEDEKETAMKAAQELAQAPCNAGKEIVLAPVGLVCSQPLTA